MTSSAPKIVSSALLYVNDNTLVVEVTSGQSADGVVAPFAGMVMKVKVGKEDELVQRGRLELAINAVPSVAKSSWFQLFKGGVALKDLFVDETHYNTFLNQCTVHRGDVKEVERRAKKSTVFVTWGDKMDGTFNDLPTATRQELTDDLVYCLTEALRDGAAAKTGKFLLHGNLRGSNVWYKYDGGMIKLFLGDFSAAEFTDDADEVDAEIREGVEYMMQEPSHVRKCSIISEGRRKRARA